MTCSLYVIPANKYRQYVLLFHVIPKFTEVRAILNWKYEKNGDTLIDVASLLLVFLDIGSYGVSKPQRIVYTGKHNAHHVTNTGLVLI